MATPTIVIGVGTSGLAVLEQAQRFYHETNQSILPEHVAFIFLETNKDNNVGISSLPNSIVRVYLNLYQMDKMVSSLSKNSVSASKWLPPANQIVNAGMGAGGIRPCGRLSLWGTNDEQDNFLNVVRSINTAKEKILSHNVEQNKGDNRPIALVVGSLTGGTGSGIFIDLAYLLRHLIPNIERVFGLFLLPNSPETLRGNEVKYANTYGALKDLEYYNSPDTVYKENWPTGINAEFSVPPFDLAQFISQDHKDGGKAISTLNGLYKMAGLYTFLNITGQQVGDRFNGVFEKRMERLVDAAGNFKIGKYGTFGLSAIHFPKDQIEEYLSCQLSSTLMNRWIDNKNYVRNNQLKPILKDEIYAEVNAFFDEILTASFKTLHTYGGVNLVEESITKDTYKINKNEFNGDEQTFIRDLFSSSNQNNYYSKVSNNLVTPVNYLIDQIYDYIADIFNDCENIKYVQYTIEAFEQCINETLSYWKGLELSSSTDLWEEKLGREVENLVHNKYKLVGQQDNVVKDRLVSLFQLMIMHQIGPRLVEIRNGFRLTTTTLNSTISNKSLPTYNYFEKLNRYLNEVIGNMDNKDGKQSLKAKMREIHTDINDQSVLIYRVYPSGNFEEEWKVGLERYSQKTNNSMPSKSDITDKNLYEFMKSIPDITFNRSLLTISLTSYRERIANEAAVSDFDVVEYIKHKPEDGVRMSRKAMAGLLAIEKQLPGDDSLPKFIVGANRNDITEVIRIFGTSLNYNEIEERDDRMLDLPQLKNILVFYDEKGNFSPIKDLPYINEMRTLYETKPAGLVEEVTDKLWRSYRAAYYTPMLPGTVDNSQTTTN